MRPLTDLRSSLAGWALLVVVVCVSDACIADLPAPTTGDGMGGSGGAIGGDCDLAGPDVDRACFQQTGMGCTPMAAACFREAADNCDCLQGCPASTCPSPSEMCPAAITSLGGTCVSLPEDVGPSVMNCEPCGCAGCLAVCDGVGPVIAVRPPGTDAILGWSGLAYGPQGTLGMYMRARGRVGGMTLGAMGEPYRPIPAPPGGLDPETEFAEYIVEDIAVWSSGQMPPSTAVVGVTMGEAVVVEIDCIVPFVTQ